MRTIVAAAILAIPAVTGFKCYSDTKLADARSLENKGFVVDDTTLRHCSDGLPDLWPNSWEKVTSLRLLRAWGPEWGDDESRELAWRRLQEYVELNEAKVLLGTQISCNEQEDDQDWAWAQQLLTRLTPHRVMGLAIGNELELLHEQMSVNGSVTGECVERLWRGGGLLARFNARAEQLRGLPGFEDLPVTTIFSGAALRSVEGGVGGEGAGAGAGENAFLETENAAVDTFMRNVSAAYGNRFAYTFSFHPYFDSSLSLDPGTADQCKQALAVASCWGNETCHVPAFIASARKKITNLTGTNESLLWVGETGWSSAKPDSLSTSMAQCPEWSSLEAMKNFYGGFLQWWPSEIEGLRGPDHLFWYAVRDTAGINGSREGFFGLVESCDSTACKIRPANYSSEPDKIETMMEEIAGTSSWWIWFFVGIGSLAFCVIGVFVLVATGRLRWKEYRSGRDPRSTMRDNMQHP
mmetsp:Transcript_102122/g.255918  ORF Transcript_102122/g.255918 Transcript_102122/m.255918 type:complete len:467 (-) Transcript_102122:101-1501(-)